MQKMFTLTLSIFLLSFTVQAQDTVYLKKEKKQKIITDRAPQAVFVELYGRGIIFSANYDRRFSKRLDGLGFSIGTGFFKVDEFTFLTIPATLNYLIGGRGKYFETGAGLTFANAGIDDYFNDVKSSGSIILGTMTFGYRSQPVKGGFNFRGGLNLFAGQGVFAPYPYISFGYGF